MRLHQVTRIKRTLIPSSLLLVIGVATFACQSGSLSSPSGEASSARASVKVGAPIGTSPRVSLETIANSPAQYLNRSIMTEGRIASVCQRRGCWMELVQEPDGVAPAQPRAHVKMHGHSFFIPRDASGKRARLEATVLGASKAGEGDCEQEREAHRQSGSMVQLDATGVEIL